MKSFVRNAPKQIRLLHLHLIGVLRYNHALELEAQKGRALYRSLWAGGCGDSLQTQESRRGGKQ